MYCLNNKKNNLVVTAAATLIMLTTILIVAGVTTPLALHLKSAEAAEAATSDKAINEPKAPMAVSEDGNNVYIVW